MSTQGKFPCPYLYCLWLVRVKKGPLASWLSLIRAFYKIKQTSWQIFHKICHAFWNRSFPIRECFHKQKTSRKFIHLIHLHRSKRQKKIVITRTCKNKHLPNIKKLETRFRVTPETSNNKFYIDNEKTDYLKNWCLEFCDRIRNSVWKSQKLKSQCWNFCWGNHFV